PVRGDDAAVGGDRVGAVGAGVRQGDVLVLAGHGDAAGVVVLDDGDGRAGVVVGGAHGGVGVDVVVVAHLLAAELLGAGEAGGGRVGGGRAGALVGVVGVAEGGGDAELGGVGVGEVEDAELPVVLGLGALGRRGLGSCGLGLLGVVELGEHPVADRVVVLGGAGERDGRELLTLGEGEAAGRRGLGRDGVALRVDDHGDGGEVLRGRTHHGGTAHVDLLDDLVETAARGDGLAER